MSQQYTDALTKVKIFKKERAEVKFNSSKLRLNLKISETEIISLVTEIQHYNTENGGFVKRVEYIYSCLVISFSIEREQTSYISLQHMASMEMFADW